MAPLCLDQGIGIIPWSPLARGRLTRDWEVVTESAGADERVTGLYDTAPGDRTIVERVAEIAAEREVSRAQVALAWMLSKPFITAPIVGTTKPQHLEDAIAAVDLPLSSDEIARLEEPYRPHPVMGF